MESKKIAMYMSRELVKVSAGTPLVNAYAILRENLIRHLPVVNDSGIVIGVISDRDFARAKIPGGVAPITSACGNGFPIDATVGDYMSDDLYTISVDGDLKEAISLMIDTKTSSCLVEKNGEIVGIITTEDLLRMLTEYMEGPIGSLRTKIESFLVNSPLGAMGYMLSNMGL